jgi:hypothetical protein
MEDGGWRMEDGRGAGELSLKAPLLNVPWSQVTLLRPFRAGALQWRFPRGAAPG